MLNFIIIKTGVLNCMDMNSLVHCKQVKRKINRASWLVINRKFWSNTVKTLYALFV